MDLLFDSAEIPAEGISAEEMVSLVFKEGTIDKGKVTVIHCISLGYHRGTDPDRNGRLSYR